jgi:hypothetical protein
MARYGTYVAKHRADLQKKAASALDETPVPSLRTVCKRLGITLWFMNKYFPTVRRRIAKQRRECAMAERTRRP